MNRLQRQRLRRRDQGRRRVGVVTAGAASAALAGLRRRLPVIASRGACAHPDGAVRMAGSALRVFAADVAAHAAGAPCPAARTAGHLPVPGGDRHPLGVG